MDKYLHCFHVTKNLFRAADALPIYGWTVVPVIAATIEILKGWAF